MLFAIVDIETTGGYAQANGITEISIHIHDGQRVIDRFDTLINPGRHIPGFITGLTGITNDMVRNAPTFPEVAEMIFNHLNGKIFIAHSVNFDYSFVNHALLSCGFNLNSKKLCTVRLSRKIFPGFPSYSLGNLCGSLKIPLKDRHRAGGDAEVTVLLFEKLLANDKGNIIDTFLKRNSKEQTLPPNLVREQYHNLPQTPGVYYFLDQKGKTVYVGKAINIKKRVSSHFANNSPGKQKQEFLREIHGISYQECGNELIALLLESHEIKRLWPKFNRSQKRYEPAYGVVDYFDQNGFKRLALTKLKKDTQHHASFSTLAEGVDVINKLAEAHGLCRRLTGLAYDPSACTANSCACNENKPKAIAAYNKKAEAAIQSLKVEESYLILEQGRNNNEAACVLVERGKFKGMGYVPSSEISSKPVDPEILKALPVYKENFNIRQIIARYKETRPENVRVLEI